MHLRQPGFTCSACRPFTENKERIQKINETGDFRYIHQNELDEACFKNNIVFGDFKDLPRRAASDKLLRDKMFRTAKYPKYDGYQRGIASVVYNLLIKSPLTAVLLLKTSVPQTRQRKTLNIHKSIIRKFEKGTVYSSFKDNICGVDLVDMQLINKSVFIQCY